MQDTATDPFIPNSCAVAVWRAIARDGGEWQSAQRREKRHLGAPLIARVAEGSRRWFGRRSARSGRGLSHARTAGRKGIWCSSPANLTFTGDEDLRPDGFIPAFI